MGEEEQSSNRKGRMNKIHEADDERNLLSDTVS
jgi:hypothetical protein